MAVVRDLLARKGTSIVSIAPTATVLEAARLMNERSVGGLLVVDELARCSASSPSATSCAAWSAAGLPPETTKVAEVFTRDVVTTTPETSRRRVWRDHVESPRASSPRRRREGTPRRRDDRRPARVPRRGARDDDPASESYVFDMR